MEEALWPISLWARNENKDNSRTWSRAHLHSHHLRPQVLSCTSGPRGAGGGEHSGHKQRWDSAGRERDIRGTGATHVPGETPYLVFLGKSVAESLPVYSPQRAWLRAGGCRTMISPLGRFWGYETI